jgi:hypothetical protein
VRQSRCNNLARLTLLAGVPFLLGSIDRTISFDNRILAAHNRERAELGVPPLQWNSQLAEGASKWAAHLVKTGAFEHSPDDHRSPPVGENLWAGTRGAFSPESMVGLWVAEKKYFKTGVFPDNSRTGRVEDVGHYTQLIWRDSAEIGCAKAMGTDDDILVCRYSSAGNVVGRRPV